MENVRVKIKNIHAEDIIKSRNKKAIIQLIVTVLVIGVSLVLSIFLDIYFFFLGLFICWLFYCVPGFEHYKLCNSENTENNYKKTFCFYEPIYYLDCKPQNILKLTLDTNMNILKMDYFNDDKVVCSRLVGLNSRIKTNISDIVIDLKNLFVDYPYGCDFSEEIDVQPIWVND